MATTTSLPVPLESGDRLTRDEFHRRYCDRPDIKKAELIQGVVYVASPVSARHGEPHMLISTWIGVYVARTPGVRAMDNVTVLIADDSEVQPDVILFLDPPPPGGARLTEKYYVEGPPQLVIEVAASSASYDLHDKLRVYEQAEVPEYVVWRVLDKQIDWFRLRDGRYQRIEPDEHGIVESAVFPGLRLNVPKMLAGDYAGVLAALEAPPEQQS